ncbi:hypothetical protein Prudu_005815, partial [Prunus dulcis]
SFGIIRHQEPDRIFKRRPPRDRIARTICRRSTWDPHRANYSFRAKGKKVICARHLPGVGHAQDLVRIPKWKLGRVLSLAVTKVLRLHLLDRLKI